MKIAPFLILSLLFCNLLNAAGEYRVFTDIQNRSLSAKLLGMKSDRISIQLEDGRYAEVLYHQLSSADKNFITMLNDSKQIEKLDDFELRSNPGKYLFVTEYDHSYAVRSSHFDYLSAIPAAKVMTEGYPAVIAIPKVQDLQRIPWFQDYLLRYDAVKTYVMGSAMTAGNSECIDGDSSGARAAKLATTIWKRSHYAVIVPADDYSLALEGSALAALLNSPLLYSDGGNRIDLRQALDKLSVKRVITLGQGEVDKTIGCKTISLKDSVAIQKWVTSHLIESPDYLAVTNPKDCTLKDGPSLSLGAPLIAAKNNGLVYTIKDASRVDVVLDELSELYATLGSYPEYLAIVGSSTALPQTVLPDEMIAVWADTIETDRHYANVDEDEFPDIAVGRLVANNGSELSLVVSRIATWPKLKDKKWQNTYVQTGDWPTIGLTPHLENFGIIEEKSLLHMDAGQEKHINALFTLHSAHSTSKYLGGAFRMDAKSLLSPTVIFSQGCSVAGICQDQQSHRYISKELFKLGAVAFFGTGRPGDAVTSQVYTHTLNKILEGQSLGLAHKDSLACKLVSAWDHPQHKNHLRAYYNSAFYGDPAMLIEIDSAPRVPPAKSFYANDVYQLTVPKEVFSFPLDKAIMDEWKWHGANLYVADIAGITGCRKWQGGYDEQRHIYHATVKSESGIESIRKIKTLNTPMGMMGKVYEDKNQDGSIVSRWNIQVMDFDNETNQVVNKINEIKFEITCK